MKNLEPKYCLAHKWAKYNPALLCGRHNILLVNNKWNNMPMNKLNGIALVQIISAMMIVNYHTSSLDIPMLSLIAKFGFIFNTMFVFLSGFLLARSLSATSTPSYKLFIHKRFNRIYPSFHIALMLISLIYLLLGQEFTISSLLLAFTGFAYFFGDNTFGVHLWFVSVILVCYLVCIPTYYILKRYPLTFFGLFLLLTSLAVFWFENSFSGIYGKISGVIGYRFIYHYFVFSLALFVGMHKTEVIPQDSKSKWLGIFAVTFLIYLWTQPQPYLGVIAVFSALIVAICAIQIISIISPFIEKHLSYVFLLSAVTYEIYLIHYSVIAAIDVNYHGKYFAYPLVFLISILLAFFILMMSKPYERLTRRCTGWLFRCDS